jgi:hypothetical protein
LIDNQWHHHLVVLYCLFFSLKKIILSLSKGSTAKPLVAKEDLTVDTKTSNRMLAVPLIDIRLMNVECRLQDAIEIASSAVGLTSGVLGDTGSIGRNEEVRDLRFKISGLTVKSQKDGLICVSSVRDDGTFHFS